MCFLLSHLRLVLLEVLYSTTVKLKSYIIQKIMSEVIFEVAEAMEHAENVGSGLIDWIELSGDPQGKEHNGLI